LRFSMNWLFIARVWRNVLATLMVVGLIIRSPHTIGLAIHLADSPTAQRGLTCHLPEPTAWPTGRLLIVWPSALVVGPSFIGGVNLNLVCECVFGYVDIRSGADDIF
jgi:hypothetical protein